MKKLFFVVVNIAAAYYLWTVYENTFAPQKAACYDCYEACQRVFVRTGAYDETIFKWSDCREYCRGVDQCHESLARSYVENALQIKSWFDSSPEAAETDAPKKRHIKDAGVRAKETQAKRPKAGSSKVKNLNITRKQKDLLSRKNYKNAKAFCAAQGGRLPNKEELVQHFLLQPKHNRTGTKFWASGPLYPDGSPPIIGMTADSFLVIPASPLERHAVFCF